MNDFPADIILPDDPRLTAYALGEMEPAERTAFELLLARDPAAQASVDQIRAASSRLEDALRHEPEPASVPIRRKPRFLASVIRFPQGYYAASLAAAACFALYLAVRPAHVPVHAVALPRTAMRGAETARTAKLAMAAPAASMDAALELSAFAPAGVAETYAAIRADILGGHLPAPASVRVETLVDAFPYAYAAPAAENPFAITLETAVSPWAANRLLLRVGVRARDAAGSASDVAVEVMLHLSLDPAKVARCRLIGYTDAAARGTSEELDYPLGALAAGSEKTLLFELEPIAGAVPSSIGFVDVDAHYQDPADQREKAVGVGFPQTARAFDEASPSFRFAAAVARFGTVLKHLPADRTDAMAEAARWAESAAAQEPGEGRADFATISRKAWELLTSSPRMSGDGPRKMPRHPLRRS